MIQAAATATFILYSTVLFVPLARTFVEGKFYAQEETECRIKSSEAVRRLPSEYVLCRQLMAIAEGTRVNPPSFATTTMHGLFYSDYFRPGWYQDPSDRIMVSNFVGQIMSFMRQRFGLPPMKSMRLRSLIYERVAQIKLLGHGNIALVGIPQNVMDPQAPICK